MLDQDEQWLKEKCYQRKGPYLRPFAPNNRWRDASIFIIGLNPATPFREEFNSFDHYWNSLTRQPEHYQKVYRDRYRKTEEERSRTSKRISEMLTLLLPHNVLVTNLYAYPTSNPKQIPRWVKNETISERILTFLLFLCKPRVLFFHGREARLFAHKQFGVALNPFVEPAKQGISVHIPGFIEPCWLFAYHHFVGRVEPKNLVTEKLSQFAKQIRMRVEA